MLPEDEARTICKLFPDFKDALAAVFHNRETARRFFDQIAGTRNPLYHANSISLRQAEQVFCYCNDILDSLKQYYADKGMTYAYDAPLIIRFTDSFGNTGHRAAGKEGAPLSGGFAGDPRSELRVGDRLTVEVEIDPAYDPSTYTIKWHSTRLPNQQSMTGSTFSFVMGQQQVAMHFDLRCVVTSKKTWHRMGGYDDSMLLIYRVLPN